MKNANAYDTNKHLSIKAPISYLIFDICKKWGKVSNKCVASNIGL